MCATISVRQVEHERSQNFAVVFCLKLLLYVVIIRQDFKVCAKTTQLFAAVISHSQHFTSCDVVNLRFYCRDVASACTK